MNHPETKADKPRRRRYRLNKQKLGLALLVLGCTGALVTVAAIALSSAGDINVAAVSMPDKPATVNISSGTARPTPADEEKDTLQGRSIVLDAGHGGFDPGAIGQSGVYESTLNLAVAQYLQTDLEALGAKVIMTRTGDDGLGTTQQESLAERRRIIEQSGSDIVVSIHMNHFDEDPSVCGPLVLFMPGSDKGHMLAESVQKRLNTALTESGSARSESLYVLKSGNQPCILVECGYLSNAHDERLLQKRDHQQTVAQAICDGIVQYFERA